MRRVSDGLLANHLGGRTWWGRAWLSLLDEHVDIRGPLGVRGRTLARDGNVGELDVEAGKITARVSVGPSRAFRTSITLPTIDDESWTKLIDVFASELRWTAAFAADRLPENIAEAEEAAGVKLFPDAQQMVWTDEGDDEVPGRHAIALHHAVAAAMESNPLLLATMRGRRADQVLAAMRVRRSGRVAAVTMPQVTPSPERLRQNFFDAGKLESIVVHPSEPEDAGVIFERLGPPPRVEDSLPLELLVAQAAELGWRIAAGEGAGAADDELLLAELRALRMAGPVRMAEALGWDTQRAGETLDRLFEEGRALRTGTGDKVRYRAI
ncbi:MAG: putative Zn finger protein [Glaciecola sp.]|jgi:uncharacterized Zn finger protein